MLVSGGVRTGCRKGLGESRTKKGKLNVEDRRE